MADPIERLSALITDLEVALACQPDLTAKELLDAWKEQRAAMQEQRTEQTSSCRRCGRPIARVNTQLIHVLPNGATGSVGCRAHSLDVSEYEHPDSEDDADWDDRIPRFWRATR